MKKIFNLTNLFLLVILAVSAFMRLYHIADYLTFLGDEGRDVLVVYNILHGHFTLLGPTSSVGGFFLGPIYYYFMAPFLWLFHYNPVGPAVMIALFGVVTVGFVYFVTSRFFDKKAGIIAALLYAIAPVVILYSRSSWNPNLMPITTLLLLYILYLGVKTNKLLYTILSGFLFGIAMQLHYIEVFVAVIIPLYLFTTRIWENKKTKQSFMHLVKKLFGDMLFFFIGFIIGFSPFIAFEARHGFQNTKNILNFVFQSKEAGAGAGFVVPLDIFHRVFSRLLLNMPSPDIFYQYTSWQLLLWTVAGWIVGLSSLTFLILRLWQNRAQKEKFLQYSLLFIWLVFGILFFGFYRKNIYDYYFEFLFPAPFILFGGLLSFLFSKALWMKILTIIILIVIIIVNLLGVPFRYPGNKQLQQTEIISQFILDKTDGKPFNFALITGGNSDHAYRYFFTVWGHPPVTIQYPGVDQKRTSVTDQLLVVCESVPCEPLGNSLWEIAGFGRANIVGHWHVSVVDVYKLDHYMGK